MQWENCMQFVYLEANVVDALDERHSESPEEVFAYLEAALENGEITVEQAQQFLNDYAKPTIN